MDARDGRPHSRRPSRIHQDVIRDRQNAVLDALERTQRFPYENAASLTAVDFTTAQERLHDVVITFSAQALDQEVDYRGAKGQTANQRCVVTSLCKRLSWPP